MHVTCYASGKHLFGTYPGKQHQANTSMFTPSWTPLAHVFFAPLPPTLPPTGQNRVQRHPP